MALPKPWPPRWAEDLFPRIGFMPYDFHRGKLFLQIPTAPPPLGGISAKTKADKSAMLRQACRDLQHLRKNSQKTHFDY
jgi:hypothetical protein